MEFLEDVCRTELRGGAIEEETEEKESIAKRLTVTDETVIEPEMKRKKCECVKNQVMREVWRSITFG
jgi:hypothetical protein